MEGDSSLHRICVKRRFPASLTKNNPFMKKIVFFAVIGLAVACTSSRHGTGGASGSGASAASGSGASAATGATSGLQDGSSYENAVVIKEKTETAGVDAEYKWCAVHY